MKTPPFIPPIPSQRWILELRDASHTEGVSPATVRLRMALKVLWRAFGMRCCGYSVPLAEPVMMGDGEGI